jgi:Nif-specific regulatory protein
LRYGSPSLELLAIYEVSKILGSSLDLSQTLREVLRLLSYQLQMYRGRVYLLGEDGLIRLVAANGLTPEETGQTEMRAGEGVVGRILKSGMPAVIPNLLEEPLFLNLSAGRTDLDEGISSMVGAPIKAAGHTVGVLTIDRISDEGPTTHFGSDVRLLTMVANLIGQTVRLHRTLADERRFMMRETFRVQKEVRSSQATGVVDMVCFSEAMDQVMSQVRHVAPFKSTVLIRGESGTGKELIARAIHALSPRKDGPYIRVNCAALPESLLESELFGHEKGAFTGAQKEHKGRFELASGGTLFLDEIGDISPGFQAKLLRVLQEHEFERVGGSKTIKTDMRLVCATNVNLEEAVGLGRFRADLYFRINVVSVVLPPLRERRTDIEPLARHFLEKFNKENNLDLTLSDDMLSVMTRCPWPGNVRELENCVERAATQSHDGVVRSGDLSCSMNLCNSSVLFQYRTAGAAVGGLAPATGTAAAAAAAGAGAGATAGFPAPGPGKGKSCSSCPSAVPPPVAIPPASTPFPVSTPSPTAADSQDDDEDDDDNAVLMVDNDPPDMRERLVSAMERAGWVQAKAARLMGMTTRQVSYALRKYKIEIRRF